MRRALRHPFCAKIAKKICLNYLVLILAGQLQSIVLVFCTIIALYSFFFFKLRTITMVRELGLYAKCLKIVQLLHLSNARLCSFM